MGDHCADGIISGLGYMPFKIRKLPNQELWKVYSENGTPLSKKGLSKTEAERQKTAATLSYLRKEKQIPPRKVTNKKKM